LYNSVDTYENGVTQVGILSGKGFMISRFRPVTLLCWGLSTAAIFGVAGGCSAEHYKADADEEVYKIIESKWHNSFGQKVNYKVSDVVPSANDVQIEKTVPSSGAISLAQAVAMATAHNRDYQIRKESLYLSALSLTGTRYQYTRQWFATVDGAYVDNNVDDDEFSLGSALGTRKERLLANGIEIGTSLALNWARFLTGDPRTTLGTVLSASATAPLLGAGAGKEKWETLVQAERDVLYDIRSFNRYRKTFVVGIVSGYYGVLQDRDAVTNAENNYKRVLESKDRLVMEAEAGRKSRIDVDEAEQNVLRAENTLVAAQQRYEQSLDVFKIQLSLPTDANVELDQSELEALEETGISEIDYTLDEAIETALLQRLDLANSADWIDDALRNVILKADGLGPQLNVTVSRNVNSREPTDFSQLQFHEASSAAGFDADLPLDRKIQRNSYRQALITLEQQQRQYEDDMDRIKLAVRGAYRRLQETADRYNIQKNSLKLAQERVEMNKVLLDAGRVTTRILLLSQDALLDAQDSVTAALVGHLNAKLSFYRDVGILQVRPDGMWEEQAK
jgi:outer membrane protein TolC